jgi:ATP-binding cassette subfamily A (ABC1) protein 1
MFAVFEEHKERLQVIEHSLGQCSLESVFNQFASQQDEERGVVHGMAR